MSVYDNSKALFFTGGTLPTGGVSPGELGAEIEAREAAISAEADARLVAMAAETEARANGDAVRPTAADLGATRYPGDEPSGIQGLAVDVVRRLIAGIAPDGRGWFPFGLDLSAGAMPRYPGDEMAALIDAANGVPVLGLPYEAGKAWLYGWDIDARVYPGDDIYVVGDDLAGTPFMGFDRATGRPWWIDQGGEGPQPRSSVEFVDPVTGVQPYMAIQSGEVIRYMDAAKWPTRMIGFEQRVINDQARAIAQTPDPALGIISFGGGTTYVQTPGNDYPWHALGADLLAADDGLDAQRAAVEFLMASDAAHKPLYSVFALSEPIGSTVEADALPGSSFRASIKAKVAAAKASAAAFGKSLYIDRIHLSLLEGDRTISQRAADLHYAGVGQDLAMELGTEAGQGALPVVVITQSFGDRANGISNVALAEGRLHWEHWSLRMVCATPRYPFALVPGMLGLHTPEAALKIAELQNLAATTVLSGQRWYPPSLESATISGSTITARFSSLTNSLDLRDPANHGFALRGDAASISSVTIAGLLATITLSTAPTGTDLHLDYAYGQTGDPGDGYAANRGSITDGWTQPSRHGGDLYRYALSNRVPVFAA
ncbi:hypothetical protein [Paracoccus sp. (in: a-proteobacteria)]|uniref:hypothetical protein n=1 Tax=Paracoccus sp. TaxID=267 RepID=UPI00289BC138|nr:hypothetical protein [Paracoccus sp. (in: a-proteobacteria)]